jgi:hypothetical protein
MVIYKIGYVCFLYEGKNGDEGQLEKTEVLLYTERITEFVLS